MASVINSPKSTTLAYATKTAHQQNENCEREEIRSDAINVQSGSTLFRKFDRCHKRSPGRPRLDITDDAAADRRRTQVRLAQRAYRYRKDATITTLEKRVKELKEANEQMYKTLKEANEKMYRTFNEFCLLMSSEPIFASAPEVVSCLSRTARKMRRIFNEASAENHGMTACDDSEESDDSVSSLSRINEALAEKHGIPAHDDSEEGYYSCPGNQPESTSPMALPCVNTYMPSDSEEGYYSCPGNQPESTSPMALPCVNTYMPSVTQGPPQYESRPSHAFAMTEPVDTMVTSEANILAATSATNSSIHNPTWLDGNALVTATPQIIGLPFEPFIDETAKDEFAQELMNSGLFQLVNAPASTLCTDDDAQSTAFNVIY
ncbi:hypothetical protein QQS21_009387 [Conoideocrella luteorostrata]|uniref:BZIP domain-containing protein n=1 Tax=Conoideocrella luteorostrata TaxID=1105319 RepID=A0AAJ0FVP3_9HYPO|nr:hypothetical protein QQS21_009387 [Conoideocrella luteorostrata]